MLLKYNSATKEFDSTFDAERAVVTPPPYIMTKRQHPSVMEVLSQIRLSKMLCKGTIPCEFSVDHLPILERLRHILKSSGVTISYYPPPSTEESMMYWREEDVAAERKKTFGKDY